MKRILSIISLSLIITAAYGQEEEISKKPHEIFLKGSVGTSWIILPKVFLLDPDNPYTNAQVLPAVNGFNGAIGAQTVFRLRNGWLFVPEVDLSYASGEIRVNRTRVDENNVNDTTRTSVQRLQSYVRAEIPLQFGVRSKDNFWVSFGPSLYFTLHDNKGFENAVAAEPLDPADPVRVDNRNSFGVRFRLAAYTRVGERGYIDVKFESDLDQYVNYVNDTYEVKFSFQNISIGYGFWLNRK